MTSGPMTELLHRLRRSVRNGQRLHLEPEHARALMQPRVYALLATLEAEALLACRVDRPAEPPLPQPGEQPSPAIDRDKASLIDRAADRQLTQVMEDIRSRRKRAKSRPEG
jgi:hypothetical protein